MPAPSSRSSSARCRGRMSTSPGWRGTWAASTRAPTQAASVSGYWSGSLRGCSGQGDATEVGLAHRVRTADREQGGSMSARQLLPLSGVLAVVLIVVAAIVTGEPPDTD